MKGRRGCKLGKHVAYGQLEVGRSRLDPRIEGELHRCRRFIRRVQIPTEGAAPLGNAGLVSRLGGMRQVVSLPLDLYVEGPDGLSGFTRYYEVPEIIRIGAPVYLKFGLRNAPNIYPSGVHLESAVIAAGRERVRRAATGMELLARSAASLRLRRRARRDWASRRCNASQQPSTGPSLCRHLPDQRLEH